MENYIPNSSNSELIKNFRSMSSAALAEIKNIYSLGMGLSELEVCRRHYEKIEKRDPVISELRLLDDLITRSERTPNAICVSEIKSENGEAGRTYEDLSSKLRALGKTAPYSYSDIAGAADLYIKRAGKKTSTPSLYGKCTEGGKLEFSAKGAKELIRLEFSDIDSACSVGIAKHQPFSHSPATDSDAFVLISSLGCDFEGDFAEELAKIIFSPKIYAGIKRISTVENGGVLPFLLSSSKGFFADLSGFPGYDTNVRELRLLTRKIKSTVILLCKKEALNPLVDAVNAVGLRFLFFGRPLKTPNSSVRYSGMFPFMINADFLRSLSFHTFCGAVISKKDIGTECKSDIKKSFLDDGIITLAAKPSVPSFDSVIFSTVRAVAEIAAAGVDFTDVSVSFDARLPLLGFDETEHGDALEILLGQYRAQAELCLLSEGSRYVATENELSFALYARARSGILLPDAVTSDSGTLGIISPKTSENGLFDFDGLRRVLLLVARGVREGKIKAIRVCSGRELEKNVREMTENADIRFDFEAFEHAPLLFIAESDEIEGANLIKFAKIRPNFDIL